MLKKILSIFIVAFTLCVCYNSVCAYEFQDASNANKVSDMIVEIYDTKQQYLDLIGEDYNLVDNFVDVSSDSYWWPIGSVETVEANGKLFAKDEPETVTITSNFGYRKNPFTGVQSYHSGLDIGGGRGAGQVNVIAARDGIVVYPTASVSNDCPTSHTQSKCGGGYGNYVIIQHTDGNYTLYAHLHQNTITVVAGDSVTQGQVIGKMGSSGNSTGPHLHFEVREGQNAYSATVDPLNYISADNPRIINIGSTAGNSVFLEWLIEREGYTPIVGDSYTVVNIGDGVRTVGSGVTLENNVDKFAQRGIDVSKYPVGSKIPISVVDSIMDEIISEKRSYVERVISNNSITLSEPQINALVSQLYNIGHINNFVENYKKYGNTQAFYDNWFFRAIMRGTIFEGGLTKRRNAEWQMFHEGKYVFATGEVR